MRLLILITLCCVTLCSSATTVFPKNKSPEHFKAEGSLYGRNNPYDRTNPNNIYSEQQSRYDSNSIANSNKYKEEVTDTKNNAAGYLSPNRADPQSTLNPYGAGNPYPSNSIANPYNPNTADHAYGQYQGVYNPESARNSEKYQRSLYDEQGHYRGNLSDKVYQRDSSTNPYNKFGNPYSSGGLANPYNSPYIP
ncbi:hypothetical protein BH10PSE19_BH10PSE19_07050 [soil metagenome]